MLAGPGIGGGLFGKKILKDIVGDLPLMVSTVIKYACRRSRRAASWCR